MKFFEKFRKSLEKNILSLQNIRKYLFVEMFCRGQTSKN